LIQPVVSFSPAQVNAGSRLIDLGVRRVGRRQERGDFAGMRRPDVGGTVARVARRATQLGDQRLGALA
jgi:hypothetical protein